MANLNQIADYQADIFGASILSDSGSETFISGSSTRRIKILPTLQPGTWIINASVNYTANQAGQRAVEIRVDGTSYGRQATNSVTNLGTALSTSCIVKSSSSMTVELWGYQNSGSNISTAWDYNIVQIK